MIRSKPCKGCGCIIGLDKMHERIRKFTNGTLHIEGTCMMCDTFMTFIPYNESRTVKFLLKEEFNKGQA